MNRLDALIQGIEMEEDRDRSLLHLTANENIISPRANEILRSPLSARYFMGAERTGVSTFGRNAAYPSLPGLGRLIGDGVEAAREMLGAGAVSLACLSGIHAMMTAILTATAPGDVVMCVPSDQGGHFCTKGILNLTVRHPVMTSYDFENLTFDADATAATARESGARAIYLDASVYLQPHPVRRLRDLLGEDFRVIVDVSHVLGLVMGGQFENPLAMGADVICGNTHKTFPGPHRGLIAFRDRRLGDAAVGTITESLVSSLHTASLLAMCVSLLEFQEYGATYAGQVVANANALGHALQALGHDVRCLPSGAVTRTHQVHCYTELDRVTAVQRALMAGTTLTVSAALGKRRFLRLGVQEVTARGMGTSEMSEIALIIDETLRDPQPSATRALALVARFPSFAVGIAAVA